MSNRYVHHSIAHTNLFFSRSGEYIRRAHQQDARRFFANRAERQRRTQIRTQQVQKAERTRAVTLARKYRSGDLPDIEIAYKEIIGRLTAMLASFLPLLFRIYLTGVCTVRPPSGTCYARFRDFSPCS